MKKIVLICSFCILFFSFGSIAGEQVLSFENDKSVGFVSQNRQYKLSLPSSYCLLDLKDDVQKQMFEHFNAPVKGRFIQAAVLCDKLSGNAMPYRIEINSKRFPDNPIIGFIAAVASLESVRTIQATLEGTPHPHDDGMGNYVATRTKENWTEIDPQKALEDFYQKALAVEKGKFATYLDEKARILYATQRYNSKEKGLESAVKVLVVSQYKNEGVVFIQTHIPEAEISLPEVKVQLEHIMKSLVIE